MNNPYIIILLVSLAAGIGTCIWGWLILARGRQTLEWPQTEGIVEISRQMQNDLLPEIVYSYSVDSREYRTTLSLGSGVSPSQELVNMYLRRFPQGRKVMVAYKTDEHARSTLEPGSGKGDWIVLGFGILIVFFTLLFLLVS